MTTEIEALGTAALIERCHAETARFFARQEYDEGVCRELLRRAFAADQRACAGVCEVYLPLVLGWVRAQNGVKKAKEEPEYLANEAFRRFFRYLRPEQMASMRLAEALAYLRKCTASAVLDAGRRASGNRVEMVSDEVLLFRPAPLNVEEDVVGRMAARDLFWALWARCVDDRERVVAARSLWQGWRPAEILAVHGEMFASVDEIYDRRSILTGRLRKQQQARGWADEWVCG